MKNLLSASFVAIFTIAITCFTSTASAATSAPFFNHTAPSRAVETGFPRGTVVAQLNNSSNYPNSTSPMNTENKFSKVTLLTDGTIVVETKTGTIRHAITKANVSDIKRLAMSIATAEVTSGYSQMVCAAMPPATRFLLAVASYEAPSEKWSDDVNLVWMEPGCMYGSYLYPTAEADQAYVGELVARLESIARELAN